MMKTPPSTLRRNKRRLGCPFRSFNFSEPVALAGLELLRSEHARTEEPQSPANRLFFVSLRRSAQ